MVGGATFLFPGADDHLWMLISDPLVNSNAVVIVCFLTHQQQYDQACVLTGGEHPFVKHATCVNYPGAKVTTLAKL
jgi:hypothetical protein